MVINMITFREHKKEDLPFRVKWLNNKSATIYALDDPSHVTNLTEQEVWLDNYEKDPNKIFFTICVDDVPVGFMGLSDINKASGEAGVFIMIGEDDYRGRGFGKKSLGFLLDFAFNELGLLRLNAECNKNNEAVIRLNLSLGFETVAADDKEYHMVVKRDN